MTKFSRAFCTFLLVTSLASPASAGIFDRMAGGKKHQNTHYKQASTQIVENLPLVPEEFASLYEARDWQPIWITSTSKVNEAIETLENAWTHGLPQDLYNIEGLRKLQKAKDTQSAIMLEMELTRNMALHLKDLSGPYLNPSVIDSDSKYWPKPLSKNEIFDLISQEKSSENMVKKVTPDEPLYKALQKELGKNGQDIDFTDFKTHQIVSNMERLRWLPKEKPNKYIFVNIASAHLWAIENNRTKLDMPVVVGKRWRPTYSFMTEVRGVRFNPRWTVPITIKRYDFLPKLQKDPFILAQKNIELYDGMGKDAMTLAADSIDWNNLEKGALHKITFRQGPGDDNPLGRYRLLMPNKFNVFLHDTNHPEMFERESRTLSSGCVRVEYPDQLAAFVLGHKSHDYADYLDSMQETDVSSPRIPVILTYLSVSLNKDNQLEFAKDPYRYDTKMAKAIYKNNPAFEKEALASLEK